MRSVLVTDGGGSPVAILTGVPDGVKAGRIKRLAVKNGVVAGRVRLLDMKRLPAASFMFLYVMGWEEFVEPEDTWMVRELPPYLRQIETGDGDYSLI